MNEETQGGKKNENDQTGKMVLYNMLAAAYCRRRVYYSASLCLGCYFLQGNRRGFACVRYFKILGYFSHDLYNLAFQFDLALGVFTLIFGLILLLRSARVVTFMPVIIGVFVLVDGVFKLQTAVDANRFGLSNWWLILLGSLLCIALGLLLIVDPFSGSGALMTFVGISLAIDGLQNLFNAFYTVRILKNR